VLLADVAGIERFQLVMRPGNQIELRLQAADKAAAYDRAVTAMSVFLARQGVECSYRLASDEPRIDPETGKFSPLLWLGPA